MKTITLLSMIALAWLPGCVSTSTNSIDYQNRTNELMKNPPRRETETPEQNSERKAHETARGASLDMLSVKDEFSPPRLIHMVDPIYPEVAKYQKTDGVVTVGIVINKNGTVDEAKIIASSDPIFEMPALNAVKQWKFTPASKNGKPTRVAYRVPVTFKFE